MTASVTLRMGTAVGFHASDGLNSSGFGSVFVSALRGGWWSLVGLSRQASLALSLGSECERFMIPKRRDNSRLCPAGWKAWPALVRNRPDAIGCCNCPSLPEWLDYRGWPNDECRSVVGRSEPLNCHRELLSAEACQAHAAHWENWQAIPLKRTVQMILLARSGPDVGEGRRRASAGSSALINPSTPFLHAVTVSIFFPADSCTFAAITVLSRSTVQPQGD